MFRLFAILLCWAGLSAAQSQMLPGWLTLGGEIRGRAEMFTGVDFAPDSNNSYYLNRMRLNVGVEPLPWLRFFGQAQDSRAPSYRKPVPNTFADTLDLHQAYMELGNTSKGPWGLRVGRQELIFGDERLAGAANWGNVGRPFDAIRLSYAKPGTRLDWFASSPVVPVNGEFDAIHTNNKLYGFYSHFEKWAAKSVVEPYFLWKSNSHVRDERGLFGDLDVYTYGVRMLGKLPRRFDYNLDLALQGGHAGGDEVRAWAGHAVVGYKLWNDDRAPRLVAEYNYASGDSDPHDGRRQTFDQLYPTNHNKYGTVDRIGWRNIHDAMPGVEWKPVRKLKLNVNQHTFWLAKRQDALYTEAGAVFVRNPRATSSRIGTEIDVQTAYRYSDHWQFGAGYAHLFAGPYLKQSTKGSGVNAPYLMCTYSF